MSQNRNVYMIVCMAAVKDRAGFHPFAFKLNVVFSNSMLVSLVVKNYLLIILDCPLSGEKCDNS